MEFTYRDSGDNQTGCQKPKDHAIEGEDGDHEKVANNIRESSDENEEGDIGTAATNIKKTVDNVEKENSSVDGEVGFSKQLGTIGMELGHPQFGFEKTGGGCIIFIKPVLGGSGHASRSLVQGSQWRPDLGGLSGVSLMDSLKSWDSCEFRSLA
ncbi:Hypothetical predicted protein [Octopus vulgaris]|uniref:Uncharacterized protein n=1 Tax=Octopus vulgaris TaxID=6645 RepID=A0AA36F155_OCTVU|nr:Hypothetical predicted protein [Octopus vulgaris]